MRKLIPIFYGGQEDRGVDRRVGHLDEQGDGDEDREDEHSSDAVQMESSTSSPVHEHNGDECHAHHNGSDPDRGKLCMRLFQSSRVEQARGKIKYLQQEEKERKKESEYEDQRSKVINHPTLNTGTTYSPIFSLSLSLAPFLSHVHVHMNAHTIVTQEAENVLSLSNQISR